MGKWPWLGGRGREEAVTLIEMPTSLCGENTVTWNLLGPWTNRLSRRDKLMLTWLLLIIM